MAVGGRYSRTTDENERNDILEAYYEAYETVRGMTNDRAAEFVTLKLQEVSDAVEIIEADNGFRLWISDYLDEAARDDDREEPLCRCTDPVCDLKKGKVPSRVEMADSLREGVYNFRQTHPKPTALIEAQKEYHEMRERARRISYHMQGVAQRDELRDDQREELEELREDKDDG